MNERMITIQINERHYDYLMEMLRIAHAELSRRTGMQMEARRASETMAICAAADPTGGSPAQPLRGSGETT